MPKWLVIVQLLAAALAGAAGAAGSLQTGLVAPQPVVTGAAAE